ncbi:MAG: NusG domain II-containing protein [Candidatus Latescibacterota bacterium]|jgi:hypothetical protein|tara:strand:- start:237 stop:599 length:363 start_codon:yes stop_codon:yes gene_type:complete
MHVLTTADKGLVLCLALAVLGSFASQFAAEEGTRVWIRAAGKTQSHTLSAASIFSVVGPLGESRIEIAAQGVRIVASPCRHQACVRRGWIERRGDVAVCLPNELVIIVDGAAANVDAVVH